MIVNKLILFFNKMAGFQLKINSCDYNHNYKSSIKILMMRIQVWKMKMIYKWIADNSLKEVYIKVNNYKAIRKILTI